MIYESYKEIEYDPDGNTVQTKSEQNCYERKQKRLCSDDRRSLKAGCVEHQKLLKGSEKPIGSANCLCWYLLLLSIVFVSVLAYKNMLNTSNAQSLTDSLSLNQSSYL